MFFAVFLFTYLLIFLMVFIGIFLFTYLPFFMLVLVVIIIKFVNTLTVLLRILMLNDVKVKHQIISFHNNVP